MKELEKVIESIDQALLELNDFKYENKKELVKNDLYGGINDAGRFLAMSKAIIGEVVKEDNLSGM